MCVCVCLHIAAITFGLQAKADTLGKYCLSWKTDIKKHEDNLINGGKGRSIYSKMEPGNMLAHCCMAGE